jgi:hypothetical protein
LIAKNTAEFREAKVAKEGISYRQDKKDTQKHSGGDEKCLCLVHRMMSRHVFSHESRFASMSAGSSVSGFVGATANLVNSSGSVAFLLMGKTKSDSGIDS